MNPGIFYLYEYNNSQKLRNTGFLKITRYYHSCTLQINARGIPVSYADTVKLYVFFLENNLAEATVLTEITCANHALSARMTSAESQFPGGRTLDKVDGFFLLLPNGHILAAAAPGIAIDSKKLLSASKETVSSETVPDDTEIPPKTPDTDRIPEQEETVSESSAESETADRIDVAGEAAAEENDRSNPKPALEVEAETIHEDKIDELSIPSPPYEESKTTTEQTPPAKSDSAAMPSSSAEPDSSAVPESSAEPDSSAVPESPAEPDSSAVPDSSAEPDSSAVSGSSAEPDSSVGQNSSSQQKSPEPESSQQNIRKIQRSELSVLPRRYWHLANNSFLLHGYHNYNHLILIEKDGHYWLGVPGIYDPREARAARLFGFPQFTDSYNKFLRLSKEECDPQGNFGYWCCYLK